MAVEGKAEVQMNMTTFNEAMGGRLLEGHVYSMKQEYADHLMGQGLARTPTKRGRERTEETREEEEARLTARLAALRGDAVGSENVGRASGMLLGAPPSPEPPVDLNPQPMVVTPRGRGGARNITSGEPSSPDSVGESDQVTLDLTGNESPPEDNN